MTFNPVPFTQVTLNDSFWQPRQLVNREVSLPHVYAWLERTGRVDAFKLQWRAGDPNPPHIFWDSDVAKWLEAAAYSYADFPDSQLETLMYKVIALIASAQQPDGYLNTHFTVVEPGKRFTNLRDRHELYCAGHLIEAGVAHFQATSQRTLLEVVSRYADLIDATFGRAEGQKRGYPGHEELELALVKLYRATGKKRYLELSQYFVNERGLQPHYYDLEARARGDDPAAYWARTYAYLQAHAPVREQTEVVGHAVRAMYLYSAMTDLARETDDESLFRACETLWEHLTTRRMYVTGGIGSSGHNEGFTSDYDLPDLSAYAETCASIGLVFWAHRLSNLTGESKYVDVLERALYNGVASGVSLNGRGFFYENPLASLGNHHRQEFFDCACCPPNVARLFASLGQYFYSTDGAEIAVQLYGQGSARIGDLTLQQVTEYPWDGRIRLQIETSKPASFKLHLRLPGWCTSYRLSLNEQVVSPTLERGYLCLQRKWHSGDEILLDLEMPVVYLRSHPLVASGVGRAALQRGPLVYCLESADHSGVSVHHLMAPKEASAWRVEKSTDWESVITLQTEGLQFDASAWNKSLYSTQIPTTQPASLTAIPYCLWDNRAPGEMRVWLPLETR
jgi:DUF1680 family protein